MILRLRDGSDYVAVADIEPLAVDRTRIEGVARFSNAACDARMRQLYFDGAVRNYQIGTVEGLFQITALEPVGDGRSYRIALAATL